MIIIPHPDHNLILCVEPHGEICLLLSKMLQSTEVHIKHAADVKEILADHYFEAEQPALIIMENTFAEKEMAYYITAVREKAPESKVLMVSSVDGDVATKALSAGANNFLVKPFTKARLLDAVLTMVG